MDNHTQFEETPNDNLEHEAVQPNGQSQEDKLLAGKFKSKEALIESTANLVKQVEGRDLTPTEVLELSKQREDDLESTYKGLERQFHTNRPQEKQVDDNDEQAQVNEYLNKWAQDNGFVRKQDLEAQKYEEEELQTYVAQNPSAKTRLDLIKTLSKTDGFKNKSFVDIDKFIVSQIPESQKEQVRNEKLGNSIEGGEDDWSPESLRAKLQNSRGAILRK